MKSIPILIKRIKFALGFRPQSFYDLPEAWRKKLHKKDWDLGQVKALLLVAIKNAIDNAHASALSAKLDDDMFNRMCYLVYPLLPELNRRFGVVKWDADYLMIQVSTNRFGMVIMIVVEKEQLWPYMVIGDMSGSNHNLMFCNPSIGKDDDPLGAIRVYRELESKVNQ